MRRMTLVASLLLLVSGSVFAQTHTGAEEHRPIGVHGILTIRDDGKVVVEQLGRASVFVGPWILPEFMCAWDRGEHRSYQVCGMGVGAHLLNSKNSVLAAVVSAVHVSASDKPGAAVGMRLSTHFEHQFQKWLARVEYDYTRSSIFEQHALERAELLRSVHRLVRAGFGGGLWVNHEPGGHEEHNRKEGYGVLEIKLHPNADLDFRGGIGDRLGVQGRHFIAELRLVLHKKH